MTRRMRFVFVLLLAAAAASGTAFAWTDTLTAGSTQIRKVHVDELRTSIAAKVVSFGFASPSWTDPTITAGATLIRAVHITELQGQLALISAYFNGWCPAIVPAAPAWNSITAGSSLIRASDFTQLRNYHDSIGAAAGCCPVCRYIAGTSGCAPVANGTSCGSYSCSGSNQYHWRCSGGSCLNTFIQTCSTGVWFCADSCQLYYTNGCSGGSCASVWSTDCCAICVGGYCSAGGCY